MEESEKMKMREHKKRMIANQRKKKQAGLDNILVTIKKKIPELAKENSTTDEDATSGKISSLYLPIPSLGYLLKDENSDNLEEKNIQELMSNMQVGEAAPDPPNCCFQFWSNIPPMCTPDLARLDSNIASDKLLRGEEARQRKYAKKLEMKVKCGDITEEEKEELMNNFGRQNLNKEKTGNKEVGSFPLLNSSRGIRKRQQVENIASLFKIFGERKVVVDFGCGSGNLCLALASYYRNTTFIFADQNKKSLELLSNRAREGGLTNVRVKVFSFNVDNLGVFIRELEEEVGNGLSFDLGIGLHCCGRFTDLVMEACRMASAECVVVPCCNGKMGKENREVEEDVEREEELDTVLYSYPRSSFISSLISREEYLQVSRAADDENNYEAKCTIEYDRARWAEENGFSVSLLRMEPIEATPKHHVIYCSLHNN